ncbi:hypothetical protein, partial [Virgisporangium aurantiacum]|uniref:hypothetical protein n=1 Tax=Virgisporangium aurantiacum TaxID=175570 RepID=UPI00194DE479
MYQWLFPQLQASGAVESTDPNVMNLVFETVQFLFHWGDHPGCLGWTRSVVGRYKATVGIFERSLDLYMDQ